MEIIKGAVAAAVVLAVLDALWLGVIARDWLAKQLGDRMRKPLAWGPAVAFYLLYSAGLGFFAVAPAHGDVATAAGLGAMLGLVAYGTYDLTNWATLKSWPTTFALVDMSWGTILSAASAAGGVWLLQLTGLG